MHISGMRKITKNSQAQQKWARELIAILNLTGTESVLDLGCGDGKVTAELAQLVAHGAIIGVDNSTPMIALAKERYLKASIPISLFKSWMRVA